jgi:hypothetical protein
MIEVYTRGGGMAKSGARFVSLCHGCISNLSPDAKRMGRATVEILKPVKVLNSALPKLPFKKAAANPRLPFPKPQAKKAA